MLYHGVWILSKYWSYVDNINNIIFELFKIVKYFQGNIDFPLANKIYGFLKISTSQVAPPLNKVFTNMKVNHGLKSVRIQSHSG